MVILHIASIGESLTSGVNVAVPLHIKAQMELAQVCLVNIRNINVMGDMQCEYKGAESFPEYLPEPFNKPDIAIFHEVNYIEYIRLYKQLLKRNIPYIIVPHGEITQAALNRKWLKKKIAYTLWFNRFVKKAAAVQCLSENEAKESVIAKNKFVVPNGMDLYEQKPTHLERNGMKLLYIGRLEFKIKGFDLLINAVASISEEMRQNNITIDIYGPDIMARRETLQKYIDKNQVGDIIKVNDPIFAEDKEKAYFDYDIYIQTSRSEGMPMGILEALSYGMPAIVTNGTRLMQDVEEYNCGYPAGQDVETIAKAIKDAFNTKQEWYKKGENARKLIAGKYSWEKIANDSIRYYQQIVTD